MTIRHVYGSMISRRKPWDVLHKARSTTNTMELDDTNSNRGRQIDGGNAHEAQMYQFHEFAQETQKQFLRT